MKIDVKPTAVVRDGKVVEASRSLLEKLEVQKFEDIVVDPSTLHFLHEGGRVALIDRQGVKHEFEAAVVGDATFIYDLEDIASVIKEMYKPVWEFHYGFVFLTEDGRIVTCSDTFYRYTGFRPEDVEGKNVADVFGSWAAEALRYIGSGGVDFETEVGGKIHRFRLKFRTLDLHGRRIIEVLVRTTEEERVRNLEETFGHLNYPVLVVRQGEVVYQNRKAVEEFGRMTGQKWIGRSDDSFTIRIDGNQYAVLKISGKEDVYLFFDLSEQTRMINALHRELLSYVEMVEKSADIMLIVDSSMKVKFVNSAIKKLGYTPEEVVGKPFVDFLPEDYLDEILADFLRFLRTGEFRRMDVPVYTKDGKLRWMDVLGSVLMGENMEILVVIRDVTEKRELERKLAESEKLYRSLVENSLSSIFVIQDDRVVYGNPAFEDFTGYTMDQWKKQPAYVGFEKVGLADRAKEVVDRVLEGSVVRTMSKYMTKSGEVRYAEFALVPIDYNGKKAVLGNAVDITDLKRREFRLKKLNLLLEVSGSINRILSRRKLDENSIEEIIREIEKLGVKTQITLVVLGKQIKSGEVSGDFVELPIRMEGKDYGSIILSGGADAEVVETIKNLANDLALAARNCEVEEMRKLALEVILENLNHFEFLADRLRNPLAAIKGFIEIRDSIGDDTVIRKVSEHASRMERILDELRDQEMTTYRLMKLLKKEK